MCVTVAFSMLKRIFAGSAVRAAPTAWPRRNYSFVQGDLGPPLNRGGSFFPLGGRGTENFSGNLDEARVRLRTKLKVRLTVLSLSLHRRTVSVTSDSSGRQAGESHLNWAPRNCGVGPETGDPRRGQPQASREGPGAFFTFARFSQTGTSVRPNLC